MMLEEEYIYFAHGLVGFVHIVGFVLLLAVLKLGYKKTVSSRIIIKYVGAWLIGLIIFSGISLITLYDSLKYPLEAVFATVGGLSGFAIGFLVVDYIIFLVGKWLFKKPKKSL